MGENIDLKQLITTYTRHWKWFVLTSVVAVVIAFVNLRYSTPMYMASAKIQILDDKSGEGLGLFQDLDVLGVGKNNVLDEIELISSRSNFIEIVKKLKLNTTVKVVGNILDKEIYLNRPINLNFIAEDSIIDKSEYTFYAGLTSKTTFQFSEEEDGPTKTYAFGKNIQSPIGDFVLTPNLDVFEAYEGKKIRISVVPIDIVADSYRSAVYISNDDEKSNILDISLQGAIPQKSKDIINELINIYNQNAIDDKQQIADRTRNFINDRIREINTSLTDVDETAENLRINRGIVDIASENNINLNIGAANQQELANATNQLNIASGMKDIVDNQDGYEVLPSNIGLSDPTIASTTAKFNELVQERKRLLKSSNEKNPVIVNLDQELAGLKATMQSSLNSTVNNLGLTVNNLSGQQAIINSKIYSAPRNERELRDITRRQQTTEQLYLYLLQKREEAQIAVASTSPKCKIINRAYRTTRYPIAPRKKLVLLASLMLGLLIPFGVIYVNDLLDNKIHNMKSLEGLADNIPILGELPKLSKKQMKSIVSEDRSVLSEALRILRTNLDYVIKTNKSKHKKNNIVFVSSSVSGEGKTFVSSNLAMILSSAKKKVVLIGADVRNPKIYNFFTESSTTADGQLNQKATFGFTEFLVNSGLKMKDIITPIIINDNEIDVIYSGKIPPNPAELLLSPRVKELLDEASEAYDYVVVDTAPLMVVTDTLLIAGHADHLAYVTRAGVTEEKAVTFPIKLQEEKKIQGLSFIVNDVKDSNLGYGGIYGYGYGRQVKKWWKFFSS